MLSPSPPPLERATPVFGSIARVRVESCPPERSGPAITAAFAALRHVHRLMSFHEPASELSRLNREAFEHEVKVSRHTLAVLAHARRIAAASAGAFDPTIAPLAVAAGDLPRPPGAPEPHPQASWRDVRLDAHEGTVRFARPLWLDLGGVAKGYAVDLAVATLRRRGVRQGCVDAGGDLRIFGPVGELVALDCGRGAAPPDRAVRLKNESLAASGAVAAGGARRLARCFDAEHRRAAPAAFAAVTAKRCVHADALTKVVLARGRRARAVLDAFGARAAICRPALGWAVVGGAHG